MFNPRPQTAEPLVRRDLPPLSFHNTMSGEVEVFEPVAAPAVKMYSCGPTVYGPQHIGNMRAAVFPDSLRRALSYWGYQVKQAINITDFGHLVADADEGEDKMTAGLKREGKELTLENMHELAERYTQSYFADIRALGVDTEAITFPRASEYIPEQIALIQTLEEKGYAYRTTQGVYFDVSRFPAYGKLGNVNLSGLKEGTRIAGNAQKRGPFDFTLWKSDPNIGWDSPWGKGFPGWHIECTAMIFRVLGKQIDIHTGGIEHIPVHHNNEIAQAEAATGKRYVKYWMHNAHLMIEGEKISKSLGNTVYLSDLVGRGIDPLGLRYWFLTAHYRTKINFTWEAVEGAATALARLSRSFAQLPQETEGIAGTPDAAFMREFLSAIANDLDTPRAIACVWDLLKNEKVSPANKRASLLEADTVLGLGLCDAQPTERVALPNEALPEEIKKLVAQRETARAQKDFVRADELRAQIEALGYILKDTAEGTTVAKA